MASEQFTITFYTKHGLLNGTVSLSRGERLLDLLNDGLADNQGNESAYISLSDVTLTSAGGIKDRYNAVYIAKSNLIMVATPDHDIARGICAQLGINNPPFVQKSPVRIRLEIQDYTITGNMHCSDGETVLGVLNKTSKFLPITDAKIRTTQSDHWMPIAFLAVNNQEVFSAYEISST